MARSDSDAYQSDEVRQQAQLVEDFKTVFQSEAGRRVLNEIEKFCHLQSDGFDPDPYKTAYFCGRRSVGVWILACLEMDRSDFQEIARETEDQFREL